MDMHKELERTCERAEKELCDLNNRLEQNKSIISPADVDMMDKLTHTIKSIKKVLELMNKDSEIQNGGYSGYYMSQPVWDRKYSGNSYHGTYTVATGDGYSGRRYMGRGYSRSSEKEDMISRLENMMDRATTESEANAIRESIEAVSRL